MLKNTLKQPRDRCSCEGNAAHRDGGSLSASGICRLWFLAAGTCWLAAPPMAVGQTEHCGPVRLVPEPIQKDTIRIGGLTAQLGFRFTSIFNDNANRSSSHADREQTWTHAGSLTNDISWPLRHNIDFNANWSLTYSEVHGGEGAEGFSVSDVAATAVGTTELTITTGENSTLTLRETLHQDFDSIEILARDNSADLWIWTNTVSLIYASALRPQLRQKTVLLREDIWSAVSGFSHLDSTVNTVDHCLVWNINRRLDLGATVEVSQTSYATNINQDSNEWRGGLTASLQLRPATKLAVEVGTFSTRYDSAGTTPGDRAEVSGPYGNVQLIDRITANISHEISVANAHNPGRTAAVNSSDDTSVFYRVSWRVNRKLDIGTGLTWFQLRETSDAGEEADIFSGSVRCNYWLSPNTVVALEYQFQEKQSSIAGREFTQNRSHLSVYRTF